MTPQRCHDVGTRRAFSLIEMMVVIGIIVLLAALTIGVVSVLSRGSETRATENSLELLTMAYEEWKSAAERDLSYGVNGQPQAGVVYDVPQDTVPGNANDHEPTDLLLAAISKSAAAKDILANISTDQLKQHSPTDTEITLLDAWGTEVITVFPGRIWVVGDTYAKDADGTIRTEFENVYGVCVNRRVRFVSAGPDGRFGNRSAVQTTPMYDESIDNIHSYPLEAP